MSLPPGSDLFALMGIGIAVCAAWVRLCVAIGGQRRWLGWSAGFIFLMLWIPLGMASLPAVAYVRGITSDLSVTLVVISAVGLWQRLAGRTVEAGREHAAIAGFVAVASLILYPTALGWGDWDAYRLGWGSASLWGVLALVCFLAWRKGLRRLPVLIALALLAWTFGCLESNNLWDYLLDPWLAVACLVSGARGLTGWLTRVVRRQRPHPV